MNEWYRMERAETRWLTAENPTGEKGRGGGTNHGAKGCPCTSLEAGETKTLFSFAGQGVLRRLWMTIDDRAPEVLRGVWLELYWDGASAPAVRAPVGDFFCMADGTMLPFENECFASPEGRSFVCVVPMPFFTCAEMRLCNQSGKRLAHVFWEADLTLEALPEDTLYFHTVFRRECPPLGVDFTALEISGRGRYLGGAFGLEADPALTESWWGEGEIKVWLDGETSLPTLVGTGTEDYLGTGWGQDVFTGRHAGCTRIGGGKAAFYRLHLPDPVWFSTGCRVTLQRMGGAGKALVCRYLAEGRDIRVTSADVGGTLLPLLEQPVPLESLPEDAYLNFYRPDTWSCAAYFYLDRS